MKKELAVLCVPVLILLGIGTWFWAFPKKLNPDLEGPLREVLIFQKPSPLTKQERFEGYDTKITFRFDLHGTPKLPTGFTYARSSNSSGQRVDYSLLARNYRFVTSKNGTRTAYPQNQFGVLQGFSWHSGILFKGTISAKAHRAPQNCKSFIVFDFIANSSALGVPSGMLFGTYALDLQTKKLRKWS